MEVPGEASSYWGWAKWPPGRGDGGTPKPQTPAGHTSMEPRGRALELASREGGAGVFEAHFRGENEGSTSHPGLESAHIAFAWMVFLGSG